MVPVFQGHVSRVCALIGALSLLQEVMTQSIFSGYQGMLYPRGRPNYAPPFYGGFNSINNFNPFYMEPYYQPQRSFSRPFSNIFRPSFINDIYRRPAPVIRNSISASSTNDIRAHSSMYTPMPLIGHTQRHVIQTARHHQEKKLRHHQEKKRVHAAINAGIFPAVYPHPKIQRHINHKSEKRAKIRGIPKAKSFNGILKGTALDVSF